MAASVHSVQKLLFRCASIALGLAVAGSAHDVITTKITWNREIIRLLNAHCNNCHRPGGSAFSLMTYNEGRPWAKAIQEEVLERRMPPWGAVKGFGEFRDDKGLTPEQLELIAEWVDGGAPEGEDKDLPPAPKFVEEPADTVNSQVAGSLALSGETQLIADFVLDGLVPDKVPPRTSFQIVAELPGGQIQPLLWMVEFQPIYRHTFHLRVPVKLPKGTIIRGIPSGVTVVLLPPAETADVPAALTSVPH